MAQHLVLVSGSSCPSSSINPARPTNIERQCAEYHPSVWGDHFINYNFSSSLNNLEEENVDRLKMQVKEVLMGSTTTTVETLELIDKIQRLGICYHFEKEIEQILDTTHHDGCLDLNDQDLHTTALVFRLLRQQGYIISCDVFNKFKDSKGGWDESLTGDDVRGLLSLYEASHLRIHGEDTLDDALAFTISNLKSTLLKEEEEDSLVAAQVKQALKFSLHKGLPRLNARHYIEIYDQMKDDSSHSQVLLALAKLDFNSLQKQYQMELSDITKWWKELEVEKNFPFARNRIVECYFWILGVYFEPEYLIARNILTKVISLTSIMDDIYDAYGTIEELELLTNAINKWDLEVIYELPEYMQVFYKALLDVYTDIEETLVKQGRLYRFFYGKQYMKNQANAYLKEAQWLNQKYNPTLEEYMVIALETSAYGMLAVTSFLGMGDVASKESFDWLVSNPKIVKASKIVCRLMDDIVSREFESKRGHVATAVELYIKEYGVTREEAEKMMWKKIKDAWKDINEECLKPTQVAMPLLKRILNLSRVIDVLYTGKDCYTHSNLEFKGYIQSVLLNPIPK